MQTYLADLHINMGRSIIPREKTNHGYIYFFQDAEGFVKIGKSTDPATRLKDLSGIAGHRLSVIGVMSSSSMHAEETTIHRECADYHFKNEWFRPEVLRKIENYRGGFLSVFPKARQPLLQKRHYSRVNLRLPACLISKVEAAAKTQLRSLNSMVEVIITEWVTKQPPLVKPESSRRSSS